ncbi:MAG: sorbosone dehydrogenase family protein [Ferruginibacter sp.]
MFNTMNTVPLLLLIATLGCSNSNSKAEGKETQPNQVTVIAGDTLPEPYATKSTKNYSKVIGWKAGQAPIAPAGFVVTRFAEDLDNPRWIYQGSNGDVFICESNTVLRGLKKIGAAVSRKIKTQHLGTSAGRITLFRDANKDGIYESRYVFKEDLNQPLGMLILNNHFYIGDTDGLLEFDYKTGDTILSGDGKMIVALPAGGYNNHWTRNIIASKDGRKIFITVGSSSNNAEHGIEYETRRANILEINPDGSGERVFASGLRNPVGMAWAPGTNTLWTAVNERDELGDELVPDYMTSVKENGFYGWPYSYFGNHEDPRMKDNQRPDLVQKAIVPDVALGAHTASLGLAFYDKKNFPAKYHNAAFTGQHGSWNRSQLSGYKVVCVPFANGKPSGKPEDFLIGFIADVDKSEVHGRPVGVTVLLDGSMLVADDVSNIIWRVSYKK